MRKLRVGIVGWLVLTGGAAALTLPGSFGKTKVSSSSVTVEPLSATLLYGHKDSLSFFSANLIFGAEFPLGKRLSVLASAPAYFDKAGSTSFGAGDLLLGLGARAEPWPGFLWGFYPFITVPVGQDKLAADSLRAYSTRGLDYGVLTSLSYPAERWLLAGEVGFYNPNQAPGFGSHTNQFVYRALGLKRLKRNLWAGGELSGEWFFVNQLVPEASWVAGGSPARLGGLLEVLVGKWRFELGAGIYLTRRKAPKGDSLVYPQPIYTLPVGDILGELGFKVSYGDGLLSESEGPQSKPTSGTVLGVVLYPDSSPATVRAELLELGLATASDTAGRFVFRNIPPDTYTLYVSGKSISSLDPFKIVVMPGETTKLFLTVQRAEPCYVSVQLRDVITSKPLNGVVMVESISPDGISSPKVFQVSEKATFPLPPGAYVITGKSEGYFAQSIPISAAEGKKLELVIDLMPKGYTIELPGVFFDFGSARIKPEAYPVLDSIGKIIRNTFAVNKNLKIEVGGYTDDVGSLEANIKLSEARAKAVAEFLAKKYGIDPEKILVKGYGPAHPKAPNTTEEGRAANRRVEIRFLEVL